MTERLATPEEIAATDAYCRQRWLWFISLGLLASKPELDPELERGLEIG